VRFVPWQSLDLAAYGLTVEAVTSSVQWLRPRGGGRPIPSGAAAVGRVLLRSRWPFRPLGALLLVPPFSWLGRLVYRLIADNRYRLPGGTPACAVTKPHAVPEVPSAVPAPAAAPAALPAPAVEPNTTLDELFDRD
jgi:hypothetical protein